MEKPRWTLPAISLGEFGSIWIATGVLLVLCALLAPGTVRLGSLIAMSPFASFLAVVAVGQMLVIRQRGLDMSAGSMTTLAGLVLAELSGRTGMASFAVIATLLLGLLVGVVNGLLVARVNISPIVATLAVDALLIGGVRAISGGTPVTMPADIQRFAHASLFGLPSSLLFALSSIGIVALLVNLTLPGRRFIAVGASPRAAAASGIRVLRHQVGAYAAASVCFSMAGIMLAGFVGFASQSAGADYLLPGIVAVIVGGTQFSGGRGSIVATAVAALFMAQLQQLVLSMGASPATQLLMQSIAIVLAVGLRALPRLFRQLRGKKA
jgi:ribose transport system permease protein